MVSFVSDYIAGAHPDVLKMLEKTNLEALPGYGADAYCQCAKAKIREAIGMPDADVDDVYLNAAADWFNVDYRVSAMRKDYLDAKRVHGE